MADAKWKRWLVPAPGSPHEEQWRRRLAVETQFIAWVLCTPLALVFGALLLWPQAAVVFTFGSASFLLHRALLRGARLRPVATISLTLVLAELFASTLFDDVFDPVILTWLALVPMVAGTILGGRALVGWSFAAVSVGGLVLWLERDSGHGRRPAPVAGSGHRHGRGGRRVRLAPRARATEGAVGDGRR
jgi:hypothetical protein